jgi:hypothetical protein
MYLMKYGHRNLLEVEIWIQFLKKILEDHLYLDSHHKTPKTIPPTINKQSHEIDIKSNFWNTHLTQTFQWCNKSRTKNKIPFHCWIPQGLHILIDTPRSGNFFFGEIYHTTFSNTWQKHIVINNYGHNNTLFMLHKNYNT